MQIIRKTNDPLNDVRFWLYSPGKNASIWDRCCSEGIIAIGWDEIGDLNNYSSKEKIKMAMKVVYNPSLSYKNDAHATWQFANEMKPGDIVFAKKGLHFIIGCGIVKSDYEFADNTWDYYNNIRRIEWFQKGEWPHPGRTAMKALTDITSYSEYVEELKALIDDHSEGKTLTQLIEEKTSLSLDTEKLGEEEIEQIINSTDPNAKWERIISIGKRRSLDNQIINNLKKLYHGCCQICGENPFSDFDINICEAHHIEYFSKSQNNDASNIIIICPNHHRLIHKLNPTFNPDRLSFDLDGTEILPIVLNLHLKK